MDQEIESQDTEILVQIPETGLMAVNIICRLCANPNERIIGIYSDEGISNDLATKMNTYLPVKVAETDSLPLQCCWNCASTVLAWHELVVASIEADRRLRELQLSEKQVTSEDEYSCIGESTTPPPVDGLELKSPAASLSVFCQETPDNLVRQKYLRSSKRKKHLLSVSLQEQTAEVKKEEWIECDIITGETFQKYIDNIQSPYAESKLAEDVSEKEKVKQNENIFESKQSSVIDEDDTENLESDLYEDTHINITKDEMAENYNFSCQYCPLMFVNEEDIVDHVKQEHSDKEHDFTDSTSSNKSNKKERRKNTKLDHDAVNAVKVVVEGRIYYNCKICGKSLHSPYTYIWHMRIHTGERPYVCDLCGKQFRVSQGLVRHLRETHEGIKNFGCDICGRMFATRRNVEEHRRIHTNERPYICDLCGKSFKQKASLFVHNRSHTNSFPFRCSYCNQGFRTRPPLLIHVTRHTGEKPYPCDVCGRCFRIKYELKRHKLIHSEEKPFSCSECGLSFRQKRYLRNHNKINHDRITQ